MAVSVKVQVVDDVTHLIKSPVVGALAKKSTVLDAVAALPKVVVKFPDGGYMARVPAVPDKPRLGVTVHADAEVLEVLGTAPADGAEVALVPPKAIVIVGRNAVVSDVQVGAAMLLITVTTWLVQVVAVFVPVAAAASTMVVPFEP